MKDASPHSTITVRFNAFRAGPLADHGCAQSGSGATCVPPISGLLRDRIGEEFLGQQRAWAEWASRTANQSIIAGSGSVRRMGSAPFRRSNPCSGQSVGPYPGPNPSLAGLPTAGVDVITFPPCLTHRLQPVDRIWGGSLEAKFVELSRTWASWDRAPFLTSRLRQRGSCPKPCCSVGRSWQPLGNR
jgi:hypothetical protein